MTVEIVAPHPRSCRCDECRLIRAEVSAERRLRSWERYQDGGPQPGDIEIATVRRHPGARIVGAAA